MSYSCDGRQRNVLKNVMHVQSCCLTYKGNCFLTLLLSLLLWLLKLPINK